jgi:uncharacterized membrane protein
MSGTIEARPIETMNEFSYKPVPPLAPVSLVIGLISFAALVTELILPLTIIGIVIGLITLRQIRGASDVYSGGWIARAGLALCVGCLFSGVAVHTYAYTHEVPDGYTRLSFTRDISKPGFVFRDGRNDFPEEIKALDGSKVFLKGYMYPTNQYVGLQEFILCKDSGDCCFGGNPEITDMIQVTIPKGGTPVNFYPGLVSIAGTLKLHDPNRAGELNPCYEIEATHADIAKSMY